MKEDILLLQKEFERIKSIKYVKALRSGSTGIGYTFETLLSKKEDKESKPDFRSIELKCKMGYSKCPLTLFNCAPKRNGIYASRYIFHKYSYYRYGNHKDIKLFSRKVFCNNSIIRYGYSFNLYVDYYKQEVIMKSYYKNIYREDVCTWDFKTLENKLKIKLQYMAIIEAYPYKINGKVYYKYVTLKIYKLKSFLDFLRLIEKDKIHVEFYLKEKKCDDGISIVHNHGIAFRLELDSIDQLFSRKSI